MNPLRSLRARLLLGTVCWTLGLLLVAHVLAIVAIHTLNEGRPFAVTRSSFRASASVVVLVAIVLMSAGFFHVRRGLTALDRLRDRLRDVRSGQSARLGGSYPAEVEPLVRNLNDLLERRDRAVERAIATAADLAHGLKTPLAVISQELERAPVAESDRDSEMRLVIGQEVDRMRRQMDYHLARSRAVASGGGAGSWCAIGESVEGLVRALRRLHASRDVNLESLVAREHVVGVRREDLDEMVGNLLDNACQWGRSQVRVSSHQAAHGRSLEVHVEDDGPGLAPELRSVALSRGGRFDQAGDGWGLGLAIVGELAELYEGTLTLGASPDLGGLLAVLRLPIAGAPQSDGLDLA